MTEGKIKCQPKNKNDQKIFKKPFKTKRDTIIVKNKFRRLVLALLEKSKIEIADKIKIIVQNREINKPLGAKIGKFKALYQSILPPLI